VSPKARFRATTRDCPYSDTVTLGRLIRTTVGAIPCGCPEPRQSLISLVLSLVVALNLALRMSASVRNKRITNIAKKLSPKLVDKTPEV